MGLKNDYTASNAKFNRYYEDLKKVVKACLDKIGAHPTILKSGIPQFMLEVFST